VAQLFYGSVNSDGVRIHYYRTGEEKPPIVLLHGITDNGLCWNRTALMLEPDFDVIMIDGRGHGLSDAPETGYDYEQQAHDVAAVIKQLGLKSTVVMGHSMGANTAAILAVTFPDLVKALILEDPPWQAQEQSNETRALWSEQLRGNIESYHERSEAELMDLCLKFHPAWETGEIQMWARSKKQVRIEVARISDTPRPRWQDFVSKISCPVLLLIGDTHRGGLVSDDVAAQAARAMKKCYVMHVPGAGHNIRRDQFDPFFEAVSTFLAI
jgi:N-formylmaleamate deformylase